MIKFFMNLCLMAALQAFVINAYAQNARVTIQMKKTTIESVLKEIEKQTEYRFFYDAGAVKVSDAVDVSWSSKTVSEALNELFGKRGIGFRLIDRQIVLYPEETAAAPRRVAQNAPRRYTISGFMRDSLTTESLISATVYNKTNLAGTSTNSFGFYSLTLPEGKVELAFSYVGYNTQNVSFQLRRDTVINMTLSGVMHLQEVEITASRTSHMHERTQMSLINVPIAQIKSLPVALGEVDVLRSLQLMPGIQSGSEGSTGLHVRGGSPDQNLILLDGVPLYNASHLLGFVSMFNGDAINNLEVYKGGFPARYGGRVSSVLDISMKEGNMQKYHGEVAIGSTSSRLTFEGPIVKNRTSFIVTGRRTYSDLFMPVYLAISKWMIEHDKLQKGKFSDGLVKFSLYFYDLTAKINHRFSDKDRIYLSAYTGKDNFFIINEFKNEYQDNSITVSGSERQQFGMQWGNFMTTFRWNHIFSNRLFSNTTLSYIRYRDHFIKRNDSKLTYPQNVTISDFYDLDNNSGIRDWTGKIAFDYIPSPAHYVRFGSGATYHTFNPGRVAISDTSVHRNFGASNLYAYEYSIYVEDDIRLSKRMKTNVGLHWSAYSTGDKLYSELQPRFATRYLITPQLSAKASYSRMAQYLHLLPNSFGGFPRDLWLPATEMLRPQKADQVAFGFAHNYREDYELSFEGYYKSMTDVPDYKEGAGLLNMNEAWEQQILQGAGNSYGMELFAQKKTGAFTGWVGYTLSWTDRCFDELNDGKRFPYKYDRRHDLNIAFMKRFERTTRKVASITAWGSNVASTATIEKSRKKRIIDFSAAWTFSSGFCTTMPVGIVDVGQPVIHGTSPYNTRQYIEYGERNGYRMKPYHRLDLSITFLKQVKRGEMRWVVSVVNAYNRKNPYFVTLDQDQRGRYRLMQYSLIPILLSISYQFKF